MTPAIPPDVKTLVIELPSWVGDTVMATPLLRAARAACSRARIIGIMRPGLDLVLAGCPWLDEMHGVKTRGAAGVFRTAMHIRRLRPDAILLLPNSIRSALASRISGVRVRVGYARDGRSPLLTNALQYDKQERPISAIVWYARLAEFAFGCNLIDSPTELCTTSAEQSAADVILGNATNIALLNPGANRLNKRWPPDRFAAVANHLARHYGMTIAVNGSPAEADVVCSVIRLCHTDAINLVEKGVTLSSLKGVIARSRIVITNDTGPRHLAAALGTPVVGIFGPTDHRWTTLNAVHERIVLAEPFLPEHLVADDVGLACAIEKIPVSDVVYAAESLLESDPAHLRDVTKTSSQSA